MLVALRATYAFCMGKILRRATTGIPELAAACLWRNVVLALWEALLQ